MSLQSQSYTVYFTLEKKNARKTREKEKKIDEQGVTV